MNRLDNKEDASSSGVSKKSLVHKRKFFVWFFIALIAILAVTFYEKSLKFPELVYSVYPVKATIYQASAPSRLTVLYDNQKIDRDVSAVKIGFWNRGSGTIRAADESKEVYIEVDTTHPIYDAKIVRVVGDSSALRLDVSNQKGGVIGLFWDSLKKDEGGVVQLIYGGGVKLDISVRGAIQGQNGIKRVEIKNPWPIGAKKTVRLNFNWESFLEIAMLLFIFLLFIGYCGYTMVQIIKIRDESDFKTVFIAEIITLLTFFSAIWLVVFLVAQSHSGLVTPLDF